MRYSADHKSEMRERLLKEAATVMRSQGPERLKVAEIMARVGLTHGGFYVHFASKDDLVSETIAYMFDRRYKTFLSVIASADPRGALEELVDYYLTVTHRDASEGGCPIPIFAGEHHRLPEAGRRRFVSAVKGLTDAVVSLLKRAGVNDPSDRANSAIAEMIGAVAMARIGESREEAEAVLASARQSVRSKLVLGSPTERP